MPDPCVIGVDLGGTAIKLGLFSLDGDLLADHQRPTPQPATPGAVCMEIVEAIGVLDPDGRASVVGIGLPGPMDAEARIARVCINLPGWEEVPLAAWLEPRLNRRVTLANDGNCALVGEAWKGAASGFDDVVLLTLGTGVGGGVMLSGALFTGHHGAAAEPGLITLFLTDRLATAAIVVLWSNSPASLDCNDLAPTTPPHWPRPHPVEIRMPWRFGIATGSFWGLGSVPWCICSRPSWCCWVGALPGRVSIFCLPCGVR